MVVDDGGQVEGGRTQVGGEENGGMVEGRWICRVGGTLMDRWIHGWMEGSWMGKLMDGEKMDRWTEGGWMS